MRRLLIRVSCDAPKRQQAHTARSARCRSTFARKPGRIPGGLEDVFSLELGVFANNIVGRVTVAHELQDEAHRESQSSDVRPALTHGWINTNAIEPEYQATPSRVPRKPAGTSPEEREDRAVRSIVSAQPAAPPHVIAALRTALNRGRRTERHVETAAAIADVAPKELFCRRALLRPAITDQIARGATRASFTRVHRPEVRARARVGERLQRIALLFRVVLFCVL